MGSVGSIVKQTDWPQHLSLSFSTNELSPELQKRGRGNQKETTRKHEREGGL